VLERPARHIETGGRVLVVRQRVRRISLGTHVCALSFRVDPPSRPSVPRPNRAPGSGAPSGPD
jgi:hypothetical protein